MSDTTHPLRFHKDGHFRILMVSDFHGGTKHNPKLTEALEALVAHANPDLVLIGGDTAVDVMFDAINETKLYEYLCEVLTPITRRGLPFAHVYGNHDGESGMSNIEQQPIYERIPGCLSKAGPETISGVGNYVLPILSSASDDVVYHVFALDSHREYTDYIEKFGLPTDTQIRLDNPMCSGSRQAGPMFDQVMWYYETSVEAEKAYGHKIPAVMYMHVPLPEHFHAARNPEQTHLRGAKREAICCSELNSGLFAACLERGDVRGIFCGHEHYCDFSAEYCGITLAYDGALGYDMSAHDDLRGGRIIDLSEDGTMKTHQVRLMDLIGIDAMRDPGFFEGGDKYYIRVRD